MLKQKILQPTLFEEKLQEIVEDNVRYILRRNPIRRQEMQITRQNKLDTIIEKAAEHTFYLANHPRAKVETAHKHLTAKLHKLGIQAWVEITIQDRTIIINKNEAVLEEESLLDGCYVLKTDIVKDRVSAQIIHDRYKDLAKVERAFRTMKTGHLEVRPVYVRKESTTTGHVFVVMMLAYLIIQELHKYWQDTGITMSEAIDELGSIALMLVTINNTTCLKLPEPSLRGTQLLTLAQLQLPKALPQTSRIVPTKKVPL